MPSRSVPPRFRKPQPRSDPPARGATHHAIRLVFPFSVKNIGKHLAGSQSARPSPAILHGVNDFWERLAQAPPREPLQIATDPEGIAVFLSREQWEAHILDGHPQVAHYREYIFRAIETPDHQIHEGFDEKDRYFIQYHFNIPDHAHEYRNRKRMVVVVKYTYGEKLPESYSGLVSTAYLETW